MRLLHLVVGFATLAAFLATGAYMRLVLDMEHAPLAEHFFRRSRHIYILGVAMVNLALAVGVELAAGGWRRPLQMFASGLLVLAAILMVAGFCYEKPELHPGSLDRYGLYAMLGGTLAHVLAAPRRG